MTAPRSDDVIVLPDGRRLAYAEYGDHDGEPVFLIPRPSRFAPFLGLAAGCANSNRSPNHCAGSSWVWRIGSQARSLTSGLGRRRRTVGRYAQYFRIRHCRRIWRRPRCVGLRMEDARSPDDRWHSLESCANRCAGRIRRDEQDESVLHEAGMANAMAVDA